MKRFISVMVLSWFGLSSFALADQEGVCHGEYINFSFTQCDNGALEVNKVFNNDYYPKQDPPPVSVKDLKKINDLDPEDNKTRFQGEFHFYFEDDEQKYDRILQGICTLN